MQPSAFPKPFSWPIKLRLKFVQIEFHFPPRSTLRIGWSFSKLTPSAGTHATKGRHSRSYAVWNIFTHLRSRFLPGVTAHPTCNMPSADIVQSQKAPCYAVPQVVLPRGCLNKNSWTARSSCLFITRCHYEVPMFTKQQQQSFPFSNSQALLFSWRKRNILGGVLPPMLIQSVHLHPSFCFSHYA